ncbi:MAG: phosphoserine phosphatase SerB [Pseudomonadota bacterium]
MFTISMIAPPGELSHDRVEGQCKTWSGEKPVWLSDNEAAEFSVSHMPSDFWAVWENLQAARIDMVIQESQYRRKRVLLADMDSTMIGQECIDELAEEAGVGEFVKAVTAKAMNGELDFEDALKERVALLRDLPVSIIQKVIDERITLAPGGRELVATMKANGCYAALVSGGFTAFTFHIAETLGFDENRANVLLVNDAKLTGEVGYPILGRDAKVQAMDEITKQLGLTNADVIAVGDGANDLGMLGRAGSGVAMHAKPNVAAQCALRINHCDLRALLFMQGYHAADFFPR